MSPTWLSGSGSMAHAPWLAGHTAAASLAEIIPPQVKSIIFGCSGAAHGGDMALHTGSSCWAAALLSEPDSFAGDCSCSCLHMTELSICFLAVSHS